MLDVGGRENRLAFVRFIDRVFFRDRHRGERRAAIVNERDYIVDPDLVSMRSSRGQLFSWAS